MGSKLARGLKRNKFVAATPKRVKDRLSGSEKRRRKAGRSIIKRLKDGTIFRPKKAPMVMKVEK